MSAVDRVKAAAGVHKSALAGSRNTPAGPSSKSASGDLDAGAPTKECDGAAQTPSDADGLVPGAAGASRAALRRASARDASRSCGARALALRGCAVSFAGVRIRPIALLPIGVAVDRGAGAADQPLQLRDSTATGATLATNPHLDPGTSLGNGRRRTSRSPTRPASG